MGPWDQGTKSKSENALGTITKVEITDYSLDTWVHWLAGVGGRGQA